MKIGQEVWVAKISQMLFDEVTEQISKTVRSITKDQNGTGILVSSVEHKNRPILMKSGSGGGQFDGRRKPRNEMNRFIPTNSETWG